MPLNGEHRGPRERVPAREERTGRGQNAETLSSVSSRGVVRRLGGGGGGWKREAGVVNGIRSGPETAPRRLRGQGKTEKRAEWSCNYAGKTQRCCHCSLLLCRGRCRRFSRPRGHQTTTPRRPFLPRYARSPQFRERHARLIVSLYSTIPTSHS